MKRAAERERVREDSAIEFETPDLEADANEVYVEPWGNELLTLVRANQDVIVICPWMDDAELTLATAMTTYEYPPNLTAEDEPFLISVVNELLASRVIESEELEDTVVEVEAETEVEVDEELAADKNEAKLQEDEAMPPNEPERKIVDDKVFKKKVDLVATKKQHPVQHVVKVRQPEKPSADTDTEEPSQPEAVIEIIPSKPATDVSTEQAHPSSPVASEDESAVGRREVETEQTANVLEIIKTAAPEAATTIEQPLVAELESLQTGLDDEIPDPSAQSLPVEVSVEVSVESDSAIQPLEIEHLTALAERAALSIDELVGASEDQPVPVSTSDRLDSDETEDSGEEEVATDHLTIPAPEAIDDDVAVKEQPVVGEDDESRPWAEMEAVTAEPPAEIDVVAEQILVEHIEQGNPQTTEVASRYLDKIIEVVAEVQAFDSEDSTDETKVTEELEELFIELFDEMGAPHTPELIERLGCRAIEQRVAKNKEFEDEEIADDTQQGGVGTMLKKPSVGHVTLNDAIVHNRLISKMALELCGFKASFSLN